MLKCFEGENTSMCEAIRQMVDEGIMLGEKRGEKQGSGNEKLAIARRMLEMSCSEELVINATMLTKQEVEELSKNNQTVILSRKSEKYSARRLPKGEPLFLYPCEGR